MSEINQVEILIKPQVPKVIDNQQVLVYIPAGTIATVSDDFKIDYGKLILNFNLERGTGINAVQMRQDGDSGVFDFTGKNPNATELDPTLTGNIPYGATGNFAASFGGKSSAQGKRSFAAGTTIAKGNYSAAFGDNSVALGHDSFVAGYQNTAKGKGSFASGSGTQALGDGSAAFGDRTIATGINSFAGGNESEAVKNNSFVHGFGLKSNQENQTVVGYYNKADSPAIFEVGNGTGNAYDTRKNAFEVLHDGRAKVQSAPIDGDDVVRLQDISSIGGSIDADTLNGLLKAGDGISIDKKANEEKVEIKIDNLNDFLLTPLGKVMGVGFATRYLGFTLTPDPKIKELTPVGVSYYTFEGGAPGNRSIICKDNLKTIFGNQSIVGSGNIDLYKHSLTITFTPDAGGYDPLTVYAKISSSNNLNIDSLTDLKTVLGNTFNEPLYGGKQIESSDYGVGLYMTETALYWQLNGHSIQSKTWANVTITDIVTTI